MLKLRRTRRSMTGLLGLAALTFVGLNLPGLAVANDNSGRWYQIEVILFAYENPDDDETARNDVILSYPSNWVELKDPKVVAEQAQAAAELSANESATDFLADPDSAPGDVLTASADSQLAQAARVLPDIDRDPFYRLPAELRELNRQADALKRSKSHRLLFHEAWRQPVPASVSAPAVVVSAGEVYDEHRELEGSFSISAARFLHVDTNLWLTRFVRAPAANERDYWPELPARPAHQQVQLDASLLLNQDSSDGYDWSDNTSAWDRALQLDDSYDFSTTLTNKTFTPAQIDVLRQQRRMRSGEVHYIDHPQMGMVILVKPYDVPSAAGSEAAATEPETAPEPEAAAELLD